MSSHCTTRRRFRTLALAAHYFRFNLSANMAYSASFLIQVVGMALNDGAFILFWYFLFQRIGGDIQGYAFKDVMFLWALAATGFGAGVVVFGNANQISRIIYTGELDVYLLQPKPVLPNLLLSRMSVSGWGDMLYGLILFTATQPLNAYSIGMFVFFALLAMLVLTAMRVFYHSFTFFLGNSEDFAGMASELTVAFVMYPGSIFRGGTALILHSLVPAALVGFIPARLFKEFDPVLLLLLLAADLALMGIAVLTFRRGLRCYESGNRIGTRL
jgi:ABC-2 type transport system permease protein